MAATLGVNMVRAEVGVKVRVRSDSCGAAHYEEVGIAYPRGFQPVGHNRRCEPGEAGKE
jgi:hypothetical protein